VRQPSLLRARGLRIVRRRDPMYGAHYTLHVARCLLRGMSACRCAVSASSPRSDRRRRAHAVAARHTRCGRGARSAAAAGEPAAAACEAQWAGGRGLLRLLDEEAAELAVPCGRGIALSYIMCSVMFSRGCVAAFGRTAVTSCGGGSPLDPPFVFETKAAPSRLVVSRPFKARSGVRQRDGDSERSESRSMLVAAAQAANSGSPIPAPLWHWHLTSAVSRRPAGAIQVPGLSRSAGERRAAGAGSHGSGDGTAGAQ
jgi:hypothetical protein